MRAHEASLYRACRLLKLSRTVYRYEQKRMSDGDIKAVLDTLCSKYRRYGFDKLFVKIRQMGYCWNHKRVYRVYRDMRLNLRKRPKKRLPSRNKITLEQPNNMNVSWSMDFMSDALFSGKKFRTVNLIDDCNREALGIRASVSLPAIRVTEFLDSIAFSHGYPAQLRLDNGPENISKEMTRWAEKHQVHIHYIQPGKPAQNAYIERFNRTYREEVLSMHLFKNILEVQAITDNWLQEYNTQRPHQSLGNLTPHAYRQTLQNSIYPLY
jgi:putative transposase